MKHAKTPHQVDSHASTSALDRNDNLTTISQAAGFEIPNTKDSTYTGGRILELESGLLQGARGDKTGGLSHKRAAAIHDSSPKANAPQPPRLCDCVEFIYTGKEPYTLRLTSGESFSLKPKEHFIIPRGTLARWCEYKTTLFKKCKDA